MQLLHLQDEFFAALDDTGDHDPEFVAQSVHRTEYRLRVSYLEVYMEEINDLLQTGTPPPLLPRVRRQVLQAVEGGLIDDIVPRLPAPTSPWGASSPPHLPSRAVSASTGVTPASPDRATPDKSWVSALPSAVAIRLGVAPGGVSRTETAAGDALLLEGGVQGSSTPPSPRRSSRAAGSGWGGSSYKPDPSIQADETAAAATLLASAVSRVCPALGWKAVETADVAAGAPPPPLRVSSHQLAHGGNGVDRSGLLRQALYTPPAHMPWSARARNRAEGGAGGSKSATAVPACGRNLAIRSDDPVRGAIVPDLWSVPIVCVEDAMALVARGEANRHYGKHNLNEGSSRSHTVFRLSVERSEWIPADAMGDGDSTTDGGGGGAHMGQWVTTSSVLNLVDLAGSERQAATGSTGERLREGAAINKSLSTLARVISALSKAQAAAGKAPPTSKGGSRGNTKFRAAGIAVRMTLRGSREGSDVDSDEGSVGGGVTRVRSNTLSGLAHASMGSKSGRPRTHSESGAMHPGGGFDEDDGGSSVGSRVSAATGASGGGSLTPSRGGRSAASGDRPAWAQAAARSMRGGGRASMSSTGGHIPYRDSKLTRLLKQSLGGNAMTAVVCNLAPGRASWPETLSTLKFGRSCQAVTNTVRKNIVAQTSAAEAAEAERSAALLADAERIAEAERSAREASAAAALASALSRAEAAEDDAAAATAALRRAEQERDAAVAHSAAATDTAVLEVAKRAAPALTSARQEAGAAMKEAKAARAQLAAARWELQQLKAGPFRGVAVPRRCTHLLGAMVMPELGVAATRPPPPPRRPSLRLWKSDAPPAATSSATGNSVGTQPSDVPLQLIHDAIMHPSSAALHTFLEGGTAGENSGIQHPPPPVGSPPALIGGGLSPMVPNGSLGTGKSVHSLQPRTPPAHGKQASHGASPPTETVALIAPAKVNFRMRRASVALGHGLAARLLASGGVSGSGTGLAPSRSLYQVHGSGGAAARPSSVSPGGASMDSFGLGLEGSPRAGQATPHLSPSRALRAEVESAVVGGGGVIAVPGGGAGMVLLPVLPLRGGAQLAPGAAAGDSNPVYSMLPVIPVPVETAQAVFQAMQAASMGPAILAVREAVLRIKSEHANRVRGLNEALQLSKSTAERLQSRVGELQSQLVAATADAAELHGVSQDMQALQQQLRNAQGMTEDAHVQCSELQEELKMAKKENAELGHQCAAVQAEMLHLQSRLEVEQSASTEAAATADELQQQLESIQAGVLFAEQQAAERLQVAREEAKAAQAEQSALQHEHSAVSEQRADLEKREEKVQETMAEQHEWYENTNATVRIQRAMRSVLLQRLAAQAADLQQQRAAQAIQSAALAQETAQLDASKAALAAAQGHVQLEAGEAAEAKAAAESAAQAAAAQQAQLAAQSAALDAKAKELQTLEAVLVQREADVAASRSKLEAGQGALAAASANASSSVAEAQAASQALLAQQKSFAAQEHAISQKQALLAAAEAAVKRTAAAAAATGGSGAGAALAPTRAVNAAPPSGLSRVGVGTSFASRVLPPKPAAESPAVHQATDSSENAQRAAALDAREAAVAQREAELAEHAAWLARSLAAAREAKSMETLRSLASTPTAGASVSGSVSLLAQRSHERGVGSGSATPEVYLPVSRGAAALGPAMPAEELARRLESVSSPPRRPRATQDTTNRVSTYSEAKADSSNQTLVGGRASFAFADQSTSLEGVEKLHTTAVVSVCLDTDSD